MQGRGAPDAAYGRASSASTTSTGAWREQQQQQQPEFPPPRHGSTMDIDRANQSGKDQNGDKRRRPSFRKIALSLDKVKKAFTFKNDNAGSRPGSSSSRSGGETGDGQPAEVAAAAGRFTHNSDVDERGKPSRPGERGEFEHGGAVKLTQANPRFSYDSDHAPPAEK